MNLLKSSQSTWIKFFLIASFLICTINGKLSHGNKTSTKVSSVVHPQSSTLIPQLSTTTTTTTTPSTPLHVVRKRSLSTKDLEAALKDTWYDKKKNEKSLRVFSPTYSLKDLSAVKPFLIHNTQDILIRRLHVTDKILKEIQIKYKDDPNKGELMKAAIGNSYLVNVLNPKNSESFIITDKQATLQNPSVSNFLDPTISNNFKTLLNPKEPGSPIMTKTYSDPQIIPLIIKKKPSGTLELLFKYKPKKIVKSASMIKKNNSGKIISNILLVFFSVTFLYLNYC